MTYASELLGTPVRDPRGRVAGTVSDLFVPLDADYPTLAGLAVRPPRGRERTVAWSAVRVLEDGGLGLAEPLDQAPPLSGEGRLSLARQVLDRQIIDVNGVRVVRVNDLQLARSNGDFRLVGIDVSTAGLLRRLGLARPLEALGLRLPGRTIAWQDVEPVESGEAGVKLRVSHRDLARLRPADVAQILSQLDRVHGREVLEQLDDQAAAEALGEVDEQLGVDLLKELDAERAADILEEMAPDEAADLLGDLDPERAQELLRHMEPRDADEVRELLAYPDDTAGGLMTTEFVTIPADVTAEQAIALVRAKAAALDNVYYVYAVDAEQRLVGVLSLRELIVAAPSAPIREVMHTDLVVGHPDDRPEQVARLVARYNLLALPIVDQLGHLRGVVTVDDAMDVLLPEQWKARLPRVFARG